MKFQDVQETKDVAGAVFAEFLRTANPFMPFVTEHLAKELGICDTFVSAQGFDEKQIQISKKYEEEIDKFIELVHDIRAEKQANGQESEKYQQLMDELNSYPSELSSIVRIAK